MSHEPVPFSSLEEWASDDHEAALAAFRVSAAATGQLIVPAANVTGSAREFFEQNFDAFRVLHDGSSDGLLTGYFEPEIAASRSRSAEFSVPLHARPSDLVTIVPESDRGSVAPGTLTHMRSTAAGLVPMPTRRDIDEGALDASTPELFFVADEVDRFIVQVQGSAALRLPDDTRRRVTYDGKNGHPYTSLGRLLIERGDIPADRMSLEVLVAWLKSDLRRARETIWHNESYVFFRELAATESDAPIGVLGTPLCPGRSLAVDPAHTTLGLPVYVEAPDVTFLTGAPFRRLLVAHDVGSAIKGRVRGDVFVGTGTEAGLLAGRLKHAVSFTVLRPKTHPKTWQR